MRARTSQPDTGCDLCWHAEASWWWRFRIWIGDRGWYNPLGCLRESYTGARRAVLGGLPDTWYERHRREWEATGDPKHLIRMFRHVDPGEALRPRPAAWPRPPDPGPGDEVTRFDLIRRHPYLP